MKKTMKFVALATLAVYAISCGKEIAPVEEQTNSNVENTVKGEPVTLSVSLAPETKITHEYTDNPGTGKKAVKPAWEDGDILSVTFSVGGATVTEDFTIDWSSVSSDKMTATFSNASSQIASKDDTFMVSYKDNCYDWSTQDGTLANLPEYLEATSCTSLASPIVLEPKLTYFHFIFDENATVGAGEARTYDYAYLYGNGIDIYNAFGTIGSVKITGPFWFDENGKPTSDIDIYVAAQISGSTKDVTDGLGIMFMNGDFDSYKESECYKLTWKPASDYTTGKVYKKDDALAFNNGILGSTSFDTPAWTYYAHYDVPRGKRTTLNFTLKCEPATELYKDAVILILNENQYHFRTDRWAWNDNGGAARIMEYEYLDMDGIQEWYITNDDWTNDWVIGPQKYYRSIVENAEVNMVIEHNSNGFVYVKATYSNSGKTLTESFSWAYDGANLPVKIMPEGAYIIKRSAITEDFDEVNSISTASAVANVDGNATTISLSPYNVLTNVSFNSGTVSGLTDKYRVEESGVLTDFTATITNGVTVKAYADKFTTSCDLVYNNTSYLSGSIGSTTAAYTPEATTAITVKPGESQTIGMTVASAGAKNFHCPIVSLFDADSNLIGVMRQDHACWGTAFETVYEETYFLKKVERESNWDWDTFASKLDGETCYITVANNGNGRASVRYYVVYVGGETHYQYYDNIAIDSDKNISFKLGYEMCELTFM